MGMGSHQHVFSPNAVGDFSGMVRDNANDLSSNPNSTPVIAFQSNSLREGYFKATVSVHHGRQEWKAGVESDNIFLHERFNDTITDFSQFDEDTPATSSFAIVLTSSSPHLFRTSSGWTNGQSARACVGTTINCRSIRTL